MSQFSTFFAAQIRRPETIVELHVWKCWNIGAWALILVTLLGISVHIKHLLCISVQSFSKFSSVKTENYPSYVWSITGAIICARTLNGLPCHVNKWAASSEFGTYRLCEQRRFRWACASSQSRQNLCCFLIQALSQEEPSDKKPDPWPLWMAGHAQLKRWRNARRHKFAWSAIYSQCFQTRSRQQCICIPVHSSIKTTVIFLNIRTPKKFVVITLKFDLCGFTIE